LSKNIKIRIYWNVYTTIILPVVLYWCKTLFLSLREKCRLRVFTIRVVRIFGPKRDERAGGWTKLHNEDLRNLYSSPGIIRLIKSSRVGWAGYVASVKKK
jgi:hypothetical protein